MSFEAEKEECNSIWGGKKESRVKHEKGARTAIGETESKTVSSDTCRLSSTCMSKQKENLGTGVFSAEIISKILKEGGQKSSVLDRKKLGIGVQCLVAYILEESINISAQKKRKTLFKEDVIEAVTKKGLFFLYDLIKPDNKT